MGKDGGNNLRGSADAAVLLVKDAQGVCGVGYKLRDASNYDDWMVSLTEVSCALGGYTFGHELGHNMGLDHDKYADATRNTPYSQGYHLPGTKYRTILAYYHGDHRLRANHYSNPRVNFQDVPTGDADTADAARRMTEIRFVIGAIGDESETCTTLPAPTTTLAPLCNGAVKVINVGTGRLMVSGPKDTWTSGPMDEWTYNSESKVIQAEDGRYVRSTKKGKLKITKRMRYLKGTETPWRWFQWNIVLVKEEFTF